MLLAVLLAAGCRPAGPLLTDRLEPCGADGPADALCGSYTVFEDRRAAAGRRIPLRIIVLPARTDVPEPDPLVFLAGGPGQAAAGMADLVAATFDRVRRRRDLVLVDQRGTGQSNALDCPAPDDSLAAAFATEDEVLRRLEDCLGNLEADVRLYTTSLAMDDLDEVRRHLGYGQVNLYGGSYGTRAALEYLRRHEAHVRSVVLDGAAPADMRLPLFAARDAERALRALLADCDADPACHAAHGGLAGRLSALLARLEASPARVTLTHPRTGVAETVEVTARSVAGIIFGALYSPLTASMLPLLLDRAAGGDFQALVALGMAGDDPEAMSLGLQLSVLCSEDAPVLTDADAERETAGTLFGRHLLDGPRRACAMWPRGEVDPGFRDPVVSGVPALVLSGAIDPVTPPAWGDAVARHLSRSRHLVAPATGHGVAGTPCGARLIAAFVARGDAAALDASCLARAARPPFFLTPAGPDPAPAR